MPELQKFNDAAGREAYWDPVNDRVYTEGGTRDTFYNKSEWNARQVKKYGSSEDNFVKTWVDSIINPGAEQREREREFIDKYSAENPFAFDEELARQSATAEYEPYYTELLQDYLGDIDLKRQTVQDDQTLLDEMKSYQEGKISREYEQAVGQAEKGFAGQGLFFSGIKDKNLGRGEVEKVAGKEIRDTQYGMQERGLDRQLTGLDTQEQRGERDIGREQQYSIEGGILQRENEALKQRYSGLESAYLRQFGSGANPLGGYVLPDYYRS